MPSKTDRKVARAGPVPGTDGGRCPPGAPGSVPGRKSDPSLPRGSACGLSPPPSLSIANPVPPLAFFWNPTFSHGVSLPFHPAPCESVGIADSAHRLRGFSKATATAETLELVTRSRSRLHLRRRRCLATLVPSV